MTLDDTIARILLEIQAVSIRTDPPFTYSSGLKSPIYCDNRVLISYPEARRHVIAGFEAVVRAMKARVDVVVGTATAGIPHAAWLAEVLDLPMAYVRGKAKAHGQGNQIEGRIQPGQRALLIEDLVSTGGSALAAITALRQAGVCVDACAAIFSYGLPDALIAFEQAEVSLTSLVTLPALLQCATASAQITSSQEADVLCWAQNPGLWPQAKNGV